MLMTPLHMEGSRSVSVLEFQIVVANDSVPSTLKHNCSGYCLIACAVYETTIGAIAVRGFARGFVNSDRSRDDQEMTDLNCDVWCIQLGVAADSARRQTKKDYRLIYRSTAVGQLAVRENRSSGRVSR